MAIETRLLLRGDPAIQTLKAQAAAASLVPAQYEHEIDWIMQTDHGGRSRGAILALFRGDRLVAYVPLCDSRGGLTLRFAGTKRWSIPYRTLRLFGCGIVSSDEALIPTALSALDSLPWSFHALQLVDTPKESPLWRAVEAGFPRGYLTVERSRQDHYVVDLPKTVDEYTARFSSKTRNTLRRKARKLEAECGGEMSLRAYDTHGNVEELLRAIEPVLLKTYQYHLLGYDLRASNRTLVKNLSLLAARGWLCGYVLFAGARPVAYTIGFTACRRFVYEYPGYDPDLSPHSPGMILLMRMIEDLIHRGGFDTIDFGGGTADYKKLFSTRSFPGTNALLVRRTSYAQGAVMLERSAAALSAMGARVLDRYRLKSKAKAWLRGLKLRA